MVPYFKVLSMSLRLLIRNGFRRRIIDTHPQRFNAGKSKNLRKSKDPLAEETEKIFGYNERLSQAKPPHNHASETPWWQYAAMFGVPTAIFGSVIYSYSCTNPVTKRLQFIILSEDYEVQVGNISYQDVLQQAGDKVLPKDHRASKTVSAVARRLIDVSGKKHLPWDVTVIRSNDVNAFALPGGKIVVFTGLLPSLPSHDALASVLAHEMSHVLARHGAEKLSMAYGAILIASLLEAIGLTGSMQFVHSMFFSFLVANPHSRQMEKEADLMGIRLMAKACYNVEKAPETFEKMESLVHGKGKHKENRQVLEKLKEYASTHPLTAERVKVLREAIAEAKKLYPNTNQCHLSRAAFDSAMTGKFESETFTEQDKFA